MVARYSEWDCIKPLLFATIKGYLILVKTLAEHSHWIMVDVTSRSADVEYDDDNLNKFVSGNVEYEVGTLAQPHCNNSTVGLLTINSQGNNRTGNMHQKKLPTFSEDEIAKFDRKKLMTLLLERDYSKDQFKTKKKCSDAGMRAHLIDWCKINPPVNNGTAVVAMDLTVDPMNVINNQDIGGSNSISGSTVQSIPRQEVSTVHAIPLETTTTTQDRDNTIDEDTLMYCFCGKTYAQDKAAMIQCCGNPCLAMFSTNSWYHKKCLEERKIVVPKDDRSDWYCPPCSVHRQYFPPSVASEAAVEAAPLAQLASSRSARSKK